MEVETREALGTDLDRLVELAAQGVDEQRGARGGEVWAVREARAEPAAPSMAADLADSDRLVLVGTIDGTVMGYLAGGTQVLRDGSRLGILDDVFVEPEARDVGLGEGLLDGAVAWCRERGCAGIDVIVLPGNRATKNFFETMGFTARALTLHKRLR